MSVFGFAGAVTSLGHHGTGFTNVFNPSTVVEAVCTLDELCEKMDALQLCCEAVLGAVAANTGNVLSLRKETNKTKIDFKLLIAAVERMKKGRL